MRMNFDNYKGTFSSVWHGMSAQSMVVVLGLSASLLPHRPWYVMWALGDIHAKRPAGKERSCHFGRAGILIIRRKLSHKGGRKKIDLAPRWPQGCFLAPSCPILMVNGQKQQPWPEVGMETRDEDLVAHQVGHLDQEPCSLRVRGLWNVW